MRLLKLAALMTGICFAFDTPGSVHIWTTQDIQSTVSSMMSGSTDKTTLTKTVGSFGNHSLMFIHREGTGQVEVHLHKADVMFVREGSAVMISGGTVTGGKSSAPDEFRGGSIQNGTKVTLHAGDIVQIPVKIPHQILLSPGETITYATIKVDE